VFIGGADAYYEFEINARNTIYEVFFIWQEAYERMGFSRAPEFARTNLQGFNGVGFKSHPRGLRWGNFNWQFPGLKTAVHVDGTLNNDADRDRGWTVELAFPWVGMKWLVTDGRAVPPRNGDEWRIDLSRFNTYKEAPPAKDSGGWVLSPHRVWDSHVPECFPKVTFSTNWVPTVRTNAALRLTSPAERLVFQRGLDSRARLPVAGVGRPGARVEARLLPMDQASEETPWLTIGSVRLDGTFALSWLAPAGWYALEARTVESNGVVEQARVERVGVGEVFVVVGHSVAQGGDLNLPGARDDRVNTIAWPANSSAQRRSYEQTGDTRFLPPAQGTAFGDGVVPAPFGHGTYFWARFGELVAQQHDVPVLVLNAAFGGTSLEHWAKSARGEPFEHSFVRADLRMPYRNLTNTWQRYIQLTGIRALLADQGQNDWSEPSAEVVAKRYQTWIDQARADLGFPELAVVVNRQTPFHERPAIRLAQERVIRDVPFCFPGPDYDALAPADFSDRIHLSQAGLEPAAQRWAESISTQFLTQARPFQPL
jgi:Carbohydrate esterase, sialic acid-specific acetylesterase